MGEERFHQAHDAPLGIVAGNGALPQMVLEGARDAGRNIVMAGLRGEVEQGLLARANAGQEFALGSLGAITQYLTAQGCREVIFIGGVSNARLFNHLKLDRGALKVIWRLRSFQDDHGLRIIVGLFEEAGLQVLDARLYLQNATIPEGVMTQKIKPTRQQKQDIQFGFELLRHLSPMDVGQTLVVRGGVILAVEAIEGTNACIQRAGELGSHGKHPLGANGLVVIKGTKDGQDTRLDLPTIGPKTIEVASEAQVKVIAVEAERTLLVKAEKTLRMCEDAGIALVGVRIVRESETHG